jgi:hypothetical protein
VSTCGLRVRLSLHVSVGLCVNRIVAMIVANLRLFVLRSTRTRKDETRRVVCGCGEALLILQSR